MAYEKDKDEIGALWAKAGRKGEYLSGTIDGIGAVVCFRVSSGNPKAPTWKVLKSKPREDSGDQRRPAEDEAPW
jgi:hypothetical protein